MMKIGKYLKNIWLCLKYPFLYPRNRFTGLHYNNWEIQKYIQDATEKAYITVSTNFITEKPDNDSIYNEIPGYGFIRLEVHGNEIYLVHSKPGGLLEKVIHKIKSDTKILGVSWGQKNTILVLVDKEPAQKRLNIHRVTLFPWISFKAEFTRFIHNWILQILHCIPRYTELDAMPKGWRDKFGEDICKEIKKSLLKTGGLKALLNYRITQIKEKWGCYDKETEVLTKDGWKYFYDLTKNDLIATLNQTTKELEYQYPEKIYEYDYFGKMYRLKNRGIDLLVTPNHNLYVSKGSYYKNTVKQTYPLELTTPDVYFGKDKRFIKGCVWIGDFSLVTKTFLIPDLESVRCFRGNDISKGVRKYFYKGPEINFESFLKFLGFYVAEGYSSYTKSNNYSSTICLSYNKYDEEDLVKSLITNIGFSPKLKNGTARFYNTCLNHWLRSNCGHLAQNKKVPKFIKNLPSKYIEIFLKYLFIGDGHKSKTSNILYTTSKELKDDVCELLLKAGYAFSYRLNSAEKANNRENKSKINKKIIKHNYDCWCINWLKNTEVEFDTSKINKGLSKNTVEEWINDFNGKIYCVTVPNHVIYVRRGGKGVWCGNSLHWYDAWGTEEIFGIIQKYEDISSHTCIHCGKPATYRSRGWISPYCDNHIGNKDNADKIEEGH